MLIKIIATLLYIIAFGHFALEGFSTAIGSLAYDSGKASALNITLWSIGVSFVLYIFFLINTIIWKTKMIEYVYYASLLSVVLAILYYKLMF